MFVLRLLSVDILLFKLVISLDIAPNAVISVDNPDITAKPEDEVVVSKLPFESKDNNLSCLVALAGKVTVAETVSVSNNFTDLSVCPFKSPTIAVNWSSCVFIDLSSNSSLSNCFIGNLAKNQNKIKLKTQHATFEI